MLDIISKIRKKLPEQKLAVIKKKLDLSAELFEIRLKNFLQAMYIYSLHGRGFCPFVGEIDAIWHEFILQTEFYDWFCKSVMPGKVFMHHESIELDEWEVKNSLSQAESVSSNMIYLGYYYKYFGDITMEQVRYWSAPNYLYNIVGISLEEINHHAKQISMEIDFNANLLSGVSV